MNDRKWVWIGGLAAAAVCALFIIIMLPKWPSPDFSETAIAARMEVWAYWSLVTGMVSAVAASLSVFALVWTFREQRKISLMQERPYVSIRAMKASETATSLTVIFELVNTGRTPAQRCEFRIFIVVPTDSNQWGKVQSPIVLEGRPFEIAPNGSRTVAARTIVSPRTTLGMNPPIVDTNTPRKKVPMVVGEIFYRDIYGRKHTLPVDAQIWSHANGMLLVH